FFTAPASTYSCPLSLHDALPIFLKGSTLYAGVINGFNSASPAAFGTNGTQTSFYVGATMSTPVTALKVGAAYDYVLVRGTTDNQDRKSTRLNSSHEWISYAVFCL